MSTESIQPPDDSFSAEALRALESLTQESTLQNVEQFEAVALTMMQEGIKYAERHPSPDQAVEDTLGGLYAAHDWPAALATVRQLAQSAADRGDFPRTYLWQQRASALLHVLGEPDAARAAARAATDAARRTEGIKPIIQSALENEALHALETNDATAAAGLIEEALIQIGTEAFERLTRARTLVVRARSRIALGDLTGAETDLQEAWPMVERMGDSFILAGGLASLARWYETQARLHRARGELSLAIANQNLGITRRRTVLEAPQIERHFSGSALAHSLLTLADWLRESNDLPTARAAAAEAHALLRDLQIPVRPAGA